MAVLVDKVSKEFHFFRIGITLASFSSVNIVEHDLCASLAFVRMLQFRLNKPKQTAALPSLVGLPSRRKRPWGVVHTK